LWRAALERLEHERPATPVQKTSRVES